MRTFSITSMLASLESLKKDVAGVDEASRIVGHLVAIQEKFVGCFSLADLITARAVCEELMESGRVGSKTRAIHGAEVAIEIGWLSGDRDSGYEMTCEFYDPRSVVACTRKKAPVGAIFGTNWLKGQFNAANRFNITAERERVCQAR